MARRSVGAEIDMVTFRVDRRLKAAIAEIAEEESKPLGELLRELVQDRVEARRRREFEVEARRQSLLLAEAARDPNSDEAAIMRELDANFDELAGELTARELAADNKRGRKWK
ncbi:MAG TPA: hypothetical protein VM755_04355 [Stellaceae bacterium]|nr:hypothetical protein [Stellaceae bacterium]